MDSGLDARARRIIKSITEEMDRNTDMKIVVVHSGGRGRMCVLQTMHLPSVGDTLIVNEVSYTVVGRMFDIDKSEIRLLVS